MRKQNRQTKMSKDMNEDIECCTSHSWHHHAGSKCGGVYGLGFIGAAIYYISTASSFWVGVLGILKAAVWPAFVVFELLNSLGA
ncbi:MAG: hypothetical protein ACP5NS_00890 [Candidatus Pacearchaeota archaeon]